MGVVYRARDPMINRDVALKAIPLAEEFEEGDELDEARISVSSAKRRWPAGSSHPYIVTIYDAGEDSGTAYIAMEMLRGSHLVEYTEPDAIDARRPLRLKSWRGSPMRCTMRTKTRSCTATSSRPTSCSTRRVEN